MKTNLPALTLALALAGVPLSAQPPAAAGAQPEPRAGEQNRRPAPANAPGPREGRGDMAPAGGPAFNPQNPPHRPDPFMESFFPPELIMHHQHALNLSEDQRKRLIETVQKSQPQFTELQWQLEAEQAALNSLIRTERPDEKQIVAQLDKVLQLEGAMKRGQLVMLVRLKNELTPEQQTKLRETMRPRFPPPMGGQPGQGPQSQGAPGPRR